MSVPSSAMQQLRGVWPTPGISSSRSTAPAKRGDQLLELGVQLGQVGVQRVHPGQHLPSKKACWSVKNP